jgi:hypothetical protein
LRQQGLSNPSFDYLPSFQMGGWSLAFLLAFCERMHYSCQAPAR